MTGWTSTLPSAVDALVTQLSADPDVGHLVHDGDDLRDTGGEDISVGYTGGDDEISAEGSFVRDGLAVAPNLERYAIRCSIGALDGASNAGAARARAFALLAVVGHVVSTDKTLGGVVMSAALGDWSLALVQNGAGAQATITFDVNIDAYTQST